MCGIAGALLRKGVLAPEAWTDRLTRMIGTLRHRGPDDWGVWSNHNIGLAHSRLSILDLSDAGHQPMMAPGGTTVVAFNGEIYNFRELREELKAKGYHFSSRTDTEILLHGYHAWGRGLLQRLHGMFAFALWDSVEEALLLARDRFGKKPLYYFVDDDKLLFGSEIKALFPFPGVPREPDFQAIHHYLTYQYVPSPWTAFRGIKKLPPGTFLSFGRDARTAEPVRYWQLPIPTEHEGGAYDERALEEEFRDRFQDAVRRRMVADVPLGAFLSGGVDSSAVVAAMARCSDRPVKTFSIGFEHEAYDETKYARMVSDQYGTEHHEEIVRPDAVAMLERIVWHYGEPFADPSAIPTFYVSELTRRHVTVALSGDGGDELFLGYSRYQSLFDADTGGKLLRGVQAGLLGMVNLLPPRLRLRQPFARVIDHLRAATRDRAQRYAPYLVYFSDNDKESAYGESLRGFLEQSSMRIVGDYLAEVGHPALAAGWADAHTYLPDDILVKVDVASMAYSLETRAPFLDHELAEWTMSLPVSEKFRPGESKRLMKRALEPWLPREILYRKKMGFGVPIERWLCEELNPLVVDTLLSSRFKQRGIVGAGYVEALLREHCEGIRLHHTRLWALLMLELWFQTWIDGSDEALSRVGETMYAS